MDTNLRLDGDRDARHDDGMNCFNACHQELNTVHMCMVTNTNSVFKIFNYSKTRQLPILYLNEKY
jgi:hypothetical protein